MTSYNDDIPVQEDQPDGLFEGDGDLPQEPEIPMQKADSGYGEPNNGSDNGDEPAPSDNNSAATRKKRKLMMNLGAGGVVILFIAFSMFSSWQKAREQKLAQQATSFGDEDQVMVEATTPPAQELVQVQDVPPVQSQQATPFPATSLPPAAQQAVEQQTGMPSQIMPEQPPVNLTQDVTMQMAAEQNKLITNLQLADKHMRADIAKLTHDLSAVRSALRKVVAESHQTQLASPAVAIAKPVESPATVLPATVLPEKPTYPIISVGTAPVVEVKTIKSVDSCNAWAVKGAVPGMAWIERDGKLSTVKNGDKLPVLGPVQSIDAVNFEIKMRDCTIR